MKAAIQRQQAQQRHGGPRPGSGRPPVDTVAKVQKLSPENIAWLAEEPLRRKAAGETGVSQSSIADALITAARQQAD